MESERKDELLKYFSSKNLEEASYNGKCDKDYFELYSFRKTIDSQIKNKKYINILKTLKFQKYKNTFPIAKQITLNLLKIEYPNSIEIFDDFIKYIELQKDFFISYTNKECVLINSIFIKLLKNRLKKDEIKTFRESRNLLASCIVKYLNSQNLFGFYDYKELKVGEDIGEKIFEACKVSNTFLQLLELKVFDSKENWCYPEFLFYASKNHGSKNDLFFVSTHPEIDKVFPVNFPDCYDYWKETITNKKMISLDKTKNLWYEKCDDDFFEIAQEIEKTNSLIFEESVEELEEKI